MLCNIVRTANLFTLPLWLIDRLMGEDSDRKLIPKPYWARICKRLWSPGIDSEEAIPPAYVAWRASTKNRVIVPARQARNRFLGSLKGLQIRALGKKSTPFSQAQT
jgi:hypothetical protein